MAIITSDVKRDPIRRVRVPSSKPETQRALILASLAEGVSRIRNDLRCGETDTMAAACEALGARIQRLPGHLEISGADHPLRVDRPIEAHGSGLVFRAFAALGSAATGPTLVTGDATLSRRPMDPLYQSLRDWGAELTATTESGQAGVVVASESLQGGVTRLPGNVSSQFISTLLLAAPLARQRCILEVTEEILSRSYIVQTVSAMRHAGANIHHDDDLRTFVIEPSSYHAFESVILADYTSASYLLALMTLFPGTYVIDDISQQSLQGERAIVDIVQQLGLDLMFDDDARTLTVINDGPDVLRGDYHFEVENCPNIIPTLAAIATFVDGTFTVTGGSLTRLHKSPRILAMATELRKLGIDIELLVKDGVTDGFRVRGDGSAPAGGATLSNWGDHRIFMSLYIVGTRCGQSNTLPGGESPGLSFPGFFDALDAILSDDDREECVASG